jgi:putative DNA methylase
MNRKLIEVALPLEAISAASRRDKDRKTGTIKNVHKWFAPMPTPAWRALLFASIVDDPGTDEERQELLDLITELVGVDGELPTQQVLDRARELLTAAGPLPTVLDPFCGGGSTIVEAQRLGLPAIGSDLNPVPVLITKVLTELLPAIAGRAPLVATDRLEGTGGPLDGFFADLRHYADRVREAAWAQVGDLYPAVPDGTVVAWLWARTVSCPNPACGATIPLYSSPWLSKQKGKERWLRPIVDGTDVRFEIGDGVANVAESTKVGSRGGHFRCLVCSETVQEPHIRAEGLAGRISVQLLCTVVDQGRGSRNYFAPRIEHESAREIEVPPDSPDIPLTGKATVNVGLYGQRTISDLYTSRQLRMLAAFSDSIADIPSQVITDGGDGEYARAIAAALSLCVGKLAQAHSTQVTWATRIGPSRLITAFGRHALGMTWDFAEGNPFSSAGGGWEALLDSEIRGLATLPHDVQPAVIRQDDARIASAHVNDGSCLVATDPPYFAHIAYADLSDYFYVWHRRALRQELPDLYATMGVPRESELIAWPSRHGNDVAAASRYFVDGYTATFASLLKASRSDLPMLVVYAHRQEDSDSNGLTSSGWDAMLEALLGAGVGVVGTWPIHGTATSDLRVRANTLASYVVLVCRARESGTGITDRQGFVRALRAELPDAVRALQGADTLPFDMTQAVIGPGMSIFSRFDRILEPDGSIMRVRTAIGLINQVRSEILSEQDDEFDAETRWAIQWFERYGFDAGPYGDAEKLFTATATSLEGLRRTGIVGTKAPDVWLLEPEALPADWDPVADFKTCTWEVTMHLLRALHLGGGEQATANLLAKVGHFGDLAHDLAYRIADVCESTKRAKTALLVNGLISSWPEISRLAASARSAATSQGTMF